MLVLFVSYLMEVIQVGVRASVINPAANLFSSSSPNCLCQPAIDLVCCRAFRGRVPGGSWPGTRTKYPCAKMIRRFLTLGVRRGRGCQPQGGVGGGLGPKGSVRRAASPMSRWKCSSVFLVQEKGQRPWGETDGVAN